MEIRIVALLLHIHVYHTYICFSDLISSSFLHVVILLANADSANISLKERITFSSPTPLILRKMAALVQVRNEDCLLSLWFTPDIILYIMTFSSLSVGSYVNGKVLCYQLEIRRYLPTFQLNMLAINFILMMTEAFSQKGFFFLWNFMHSAKTQWIVKVH